MAHSTEIYVMDEPGCNEPVGEMARDPQRCLRWRCLILLEEGWGEQGGFLKTGRNMESVVGKHLDPRKSPAVK